MLDKYILPMYNVKVTICCIANTLLERKIIMNITIKRIVAIALATLMCIAVFAACASEVDMDTLDTTPHPSADVDIPGNNESDITTPEPEEIRINPNLPESDFGGHKFNVLTRGQSSANWCSRDIYSE